MTIKLGDLRELVDLQTQSGPDRGTDWTTTARKLYAAVKPLDASERIEAASLGSAITYSVFIRYRAGVVATMRVLWRPYLETEPRVLEIVGVVPHEGKREFLRLDCAEAA